LYVTSYSCFLYFVDILSVDSAHCERS
jgi:hypothetical protein